MTVKELIKKLKMFDPDTKVFTLTEKRRDPVLTVLSIEDKTVLVTESFNDFCMRDMLKLKKTTGQTKRNKVIEK